MGGIYVDFSVVNQLNSPALNSNTFANRPAAGQIGRLFISTDTFEIYRDNGTTWDLIGGPGTSTITGTGTPGTMTVFTGAQSIGDSSLLEGATSFTTTKDFQADAIYLNSMTLGSGALYYSGNRLTLANYNPGGDVMIEANGGAFAQFISGTDLSTTFYGNIIRNGGLSTQFLKADGSLDSSTYLTSNIYTADGTLAAARTVNLNNHNLRFEGGANTARVRLSANNNVARIFSFATADVARWAFRIDGNETGSNAGADFQIRRYNDAGAFIDAPIVINRATGHVGIGPGLQQLETFNVTGSSLFSHSYTQGNDFNRKGVFAFLNTTTNSGAGFTNGYNYNALSGLHWDNFSANTTIPNGVTIGGTYSGAQVGFDTINTTVTLAQGVGGGLRTFSGVISQIGIAAPTTGGVVTHASGFQALAPYYIGANLPTITNYFGVAINDSSEYSSVAITNRWGIYQNGATDLNYLNGNLLIKSTTDNGNALQVTGNGNITGNLGIGTAVAAQKLQINGPLALSNLAEDFTTNQEYSYPIIYASNLSGLGNGELVIQPRTTATRNIRFVTRAAGVVSSTNPGTRMLIRFDGNVGISDNNPGNKLTVTVDGLGNEDGILVRAGSQGDGIKIVQRYLSDRVVATLGQSNISGISDSGALRLYDVGGSETVRLGGKNGFPSFITSGNLLIGTTTDTGQKLQVNGTSYFNGQTTINGVLSVQQTQLTNINVNTQTDIYTNFPVGKILIFSVQINWQSNGAAQQSFLVFAGATNTAWGTPNSGVNVVSSIDWSQGFAGGTASFAITGTGTSRNLAVTMSNASTYPVTVTVSLITN